MPDVIPRNLTHISQSFCISILNKGEVINICNVCETHPLNHWYSLAMPSNNAVPMALRAPDKCSAPPVLVAPANDRALWCFRRKGVSWNRGTPGTPKSSVSIWFSITNHPFWGAFIYGTPHTTMSLKIRDLPQDMATRMRRWWSTMGSWSTLFSDKPVFRTNNQPVAIAYRPDLETMFYCHRKFGCNPCNYGSPLVNWGCTSK